MPLIPKSDKSRTYRRWGGGSRGWQPFGWSAKATLTTALAGSNNDLLFTAYERGSGGNSYRIRYVVSGNNTPLTVTISDKDITVNVATNGGGTATSTAAQVKAAVNAAVPLHVVATDAPSNDGTGVVTALAFTSLSGGSDFVLA
jgi:Bacteriophage tail sheath protein